MKNKPESLGHYAERMALRLAIAAGSIMGLLVVLLNLDRNPVPMLGDWRAFAALGLYSIVPITLVVGFIAYRWGANAWNERVAADRRRLENLPAIPIALAYAILVIFIAALALQLVEYAFRDLALAMLQGAFIVGAAGAALTQLVAKQIMLLTVSKLVGLTFTVIAIGVYLTAATIDDPLWWKVSFSYLGTMQSSSNTIFNLTLSFTGLLILIWLPFFLNDLHILVRHDLAWDRSTEVFRIAFIVLGIGVAFVGIFKSGYTPFTSLVHNWSAYSLAVVFAVMMVGLPRLVPGFPREVFVMSWTLMGLLAATLLLAALGYFNTVGLEMLVFVLGLTWLSSFIGNVSSLARETEPDAFPG